MFVPQRRSIQATTTSCRNCSLFTFLDNHLIRKLINQWVIHWGGHAVHRPVGHPVNYWQVCCSSVGCCGVHISVLSNDRIGCFSISAVKPKPSLHERERLSILSCNTREALPARPHPSYMLLQYRFVSLSAARPHITSPPAFMAIWATLLTCVLQEQPQPLYW
jgi:hypothetical protein